MQSLTKQFSFLLLSCVTIIFSQISLADYSDPFVPIYSKGDNLSNALVKPTAIYSEVSGSKVVISNMPAYKTQDELGDCRAFSLATLVQKYTCDQWKDEIRDCKNPPADSAISSFGMMVYTNRNFEGDGTLQVNQDSHRNIYEVITELSKSGNRLILESCRPFDKLVNNFSTADGSGIAKRDKFFEYLKKMYDSKKAKTEADIADCPECLAEMNQNIGINADINHLRKALVKKSYDEFLYQLFFNGCKFENFPAGFRAVVYPDDTTNATIANIKDKVLEGLNKGKPVLLPSLCVSGNRGQDCESSHSLVVSGYKKVCDIVAKTKCKEVFKVHNSWGSDWQKAKNDGWVDAESLISNISRVKPKNMSAYKIASASVVWLEP